MTAENKFQIEALEHEAFKYIDCGLLDEAADIAAVVELLESGAVAWCPVHYDNWNQESIERRAA
ncbi:MAG TPA: hypothetical protein V6D22_07480 [Candidatus Obscuribacterales bacterium]